MVIPPTQLVYLELNIHHITLDYKDVVSLQIFLVTMKPGLHKFSLAPFNHLKACLPWLTSAQPFEERLLRVPSVVEIRLASAWEKSHLSSGGLAMESSPQEGLPSAVMARL